MARSSAIAWFDAAPSVQAVLYFMEPSVEGAYEVGILTFYRLKRDQDSASCDFAKGRRGEEDVAGVGHGGAREERSGDEGAVDSGGVIFAGGDHPQTGNGGPIGDRRPSAKA